jgi:hypothetical protein
MNGNPDGEQAVFRLSVYMDMARKAKEVLGVPLKSWSPRVEFLVEGDDLTYWERLALSHLAKVHVCSREEFKTRQVASLPVKFYLDERAAALAGIEANLELCLKAVEEKDELVQRREGRQ